MVLMVDPRVPRLSATTNGQLVDRAIRHALFLERLKTGEVKSVINFYNKHVFPDLLREYEGRVARAFYKGIDPGPWTTNRLKEVISSAHQQMRVGTRVAYKNLEGSLKDIALSEAKWQTEAMSEAVPKAFGLDFRSPSPGLLQSFVSKNPFDGRLTKKWFSDLSNGLKVEAQKQLGIGLAAGEPLPKIVSRFRGALQMTRRHAETIVRTSVTHISNLSRQATYDANQDVVKGWQFIATLDSRTTDICMSLDGRVYPVGEGAKDMPPLHHQCRSTTAPILKSWEELGISRLKEAPAGARASMTGLVPSKMTYGGWLAQQERWVIDQALGPARAKLFLRGKVPLPRFVNDAGKSLTLKQLEELEKRLGGSPPKKPRPPRKAKRPTVKNGKQVRQDLERALDTIEDEIGRVMANQKSYADVLNHEFKGPNWRVLDLKYSPNASDMIKRAKVEYYKLFDDLERLKKMRTQKTLEVLKVKDPIEFNITYSAGLPKAKAAKAAAEAFRSSVDEGVEFLRSITSKSKLDRLDVEVIKLKKGVRAFQRGDTINLSSTTRIKTVVHELGHSLEHNSSWFKEGSQEFLKKRVASMPPGDINGKLQKLQKHFPGHGYAADEKAWKDKFIHAYMGKDYQGRASEIISMGVELLMEDPGKFIREDPEMFEWLINILRGIE